MDIDRTLNPGKVTIMCSDGLHIQGSVNVRYEERISDLFTQGYQPFIVVFDAKFGGQSGKTIVVNKSNIVWVMPE